MSMNYPVISKILGVILVLLSIAMLPSLLIAIILTERMSALAFLLTIIPILLLGLLILRKVHPEVSTIRIRDGILVVALTWLLATLIGTFPYMLSGVTSSYADAVFESASGFTTSGATIFSDVEILPKSLLFWRSFSQWIGGMGLIVLTTSIFPVLGIAGQTLAKSEAPGSSFDKFSSHFSDTAKLMYLIYILLTAACITLLLLGGLKPFDAFIFAFSSVSSGGLCNYNDGVVHFNSAYIESVVSLFSTAASINFTLYFVLSRGRFREFFKNTELRAFLGIMAGAAILMTLDLRMNNVFGSLPETIRHAVFQTVSFMTTTGHHSADFYAWPTFSKFLLFTLLFIGGCSLSTCGGIKVTRIVILSKLVWRGFYRRLHPNATLTVKMQSKAVNFDLVATISAFIAAYFGTFLLGALVISLDNFDILTTISASASTLSNIGAGFGEMGVSGDFSMFSGFSKLFLSLEMLIGRLEIYTILILFTPTFWNPDK